MKIKAGLLAVLGLAGWVSGVSAVPITAADFVTVDGTEWAQVDLFNNLSWNDIDVVCSAGPCSGTLNGYDVTGWTWASLDRLNALFNHYIGSAEMGPDPGLFGEPMGTWAAAFAGDGWRTRGHSSGWETAGLIRTLDTTWGPDPFAIRARIGFNSSDGLNYAMTTGADLQDGAYVTVGGWFYRAGALQMPAPGTLFLFVMGTTVLCWTRKSKEPPQSTRSLQAEAPQPCLAR